MIRIEQFKQLDLRVGKVIEIKDHPSADQLYILLVNIGGKEPLSLVAGLKGHYLASDLLGKEIIVIINLEPAVIRGVESQGMLLAAEFKGKVTVLTPDQTINVGAKIR